MFSMRHCNSLAALLLGTTLLLGGCGGVAPVKEEAPPPPQESQGPSEEELRARQAEQAFEEAMAAMKSGNHKVALERFRAMTEHYPEYAGPWVNLAILLERREQYDEAEKAYRKALELNPDNPEIYNQLAVFYRERGQFHQASTLYEEGCERHPDYAPLHRNAGILYDLYLRQYKAALKHYEAYVKLVPDDKEVSTWLADLRQRLAR